jgi:hypothetical protein
MHKWIVMFYPNEESKGCRVVVTPAPTLMQALTQVVIEEKVSPNTVLSVTRQDKMAPMSRKELGT